MFNIEKSISNIDVYTKEMSINLDDKLFFLNQLPKDNYLYVDFGCADGSLLNKLQSLSGGYFIGYDKSEEMILKAKSKNSNIFYTTKWNEVLEFLKKFPNKKVLILSSVIHEVYSYAKSSEDIVKFWLRVLFTGFDYIVIRDTMPLKSIDRVSNSNDQIKVITNANKEQLNEFEFNFGSILNNKNLVHFLLKYRYKTNWSREVNENYFPIYVEDFIKKFKNYNMLYFDSFKLPFIEDSIYKDFGIKLKDNTHIKVIFQYDKN